MLSLGFIYWFLMLLWLALGVWWNWPGNAGSPYLPIGNTLLLFVLFVLLGWRVFGAPIHV